MRTAGPPPPSSLFVACCCFVSIAPYYASGELSWACELSRPMSIMADPPTSVDDGSSGTSSQDWFLDNGNRLLRDRRSLPRAPRLPRDDAVRLPVGYNERRQRRRAARSLSYGIYDASNATNTSNLFESAVGVMANVTYPSDSEGANNVGDDGDAAGEPTAYIPLSLDDEANVTEDDIDAGVGHITVYMDVRLCGCASSLLRVVDTEFYCPASSSYCSAWMSSRSREEYGVECIQYMNWAVPWSRNSWYYILFLFVLFGIFLLCSRAGHDAIKYPISRCFPGMNVWITETLLRAEMQSRNRIISQYERAIRVRRRTEGWISGYSIKTKRHASGGGGCQIAKDERSEDGGGCEGRNEFDSMCTICLLEVNDGDRVADLSCGHVFHPDCLGEWILKKNSCPLCQDRDIAKEIRSYETDDDANNQESRTEFKLLSRWRCEARDSFVDFATGRSRRGRRTLSNR